MALGRVITTIPAPASLCYGLTWDGTHLWTVDDDTDTAYKIDPSTGAVVHTIPTPHANPRGIEWSGKYLLISGAGVGSPALVDPVTGASVDVLPNVPVVSGHTFIWNGKVYWYFPYAGGLTPGYQLDPTTGTYEQIWTPADDFITDGCWDGRGIWLIENGRDWAWKHDPFTGALLAQFDTPAGRPEGLAWDGQYLWILDRDTELIYQVEASTNIIASAIRALGPIGQWGLWEAGGAVAYDISGNSPAGERNGTHVGITPQDRPGPGDGSMAPRYDGANDYTSIGTAPFIAAFNPSEGAAIIYGKVFNAGVWIDGAGRNLLILRVNGANEVTLQRVAVNNRLIGRYTAGGVGLTRNVDGVTTTEWFQLGISWSAAADEVRVYYNGLQVGAIFNGLGVWVGALVPATTCIGAFSTAPLLVWNGWESQGAVFDRPITPAEFRGLPRGGP